MVDINIKKTVFNKDDDDGLLISSSAIPHHKSNRSLRNKQYDVCAPFFAILIRMSHEK